ncbi:hypothetical protein J3458_006864 [Metarhizium acridum]|uniref:uncharacterized protein n=1 Tax=Metarhizium acridum TaxID=92637 RepID=UPI001C6BCAA3|nr:hypothetical protein J3458_006864 [Metarhizium acridum]
MNRASRPKQFGAHCFPFRYTKRLRLPHLSSPPQPANTMYAMTTGQAVDSNIAASTDPPPTRILSMGPFQRSTRAHIVKIMAQTYRTSPHMMTRRMSPKRSLGLSTTLDVSGTKVDERLLPMVALLG